MQGYQGSRPQFERGALGSAVIAGGVQMKLLAIWFCGTQSMEKGASEDRLARLLICWRQTPGSPETACWQRWMTGLAGERAIGEGKGGGRGSTEVVLVIVVEVVPSGAEAKIFVMLCFEYRVLVAQDQDVLNRYQDNEIEYLRTFVICLFVFLCLIFVSFFVSFQLFFFLLLIYFMCVLQFCYHCTS